MRRVLLALAPVLLAVLLAAGADPLWLTVPLGLVAVLVAPGHALVDLVAPHHLRSAAALALVPATSAGCVALGGVALHLVGVPLAALSWSLLLAVVTVGATVLAARRDGATAPPAVPRPAVGDVVRVGLCLALAAGAVVLAQDSQRDLDAGQPLTQLWVAPGNDGLRTVHLRNEEGGARTYDVRVRVGTGVVQQLQAAVADGGTWTTTVPVRRDAPRLERLSVDVYLDGGDRPYRRVVLEDGVR